MTPIVVMMYHKKFIMDRLRIILILLAKRMVMQKIVDKINQLATKVGM